MLFVSYLIFHFPDVMNILYKFISSSFISVLHPPVNGVREEPMGIFSHIHTYYYIHPALFI